MMKIAILGATGIVGQEFLGLWCRSFSMVPNLFGSPRSAGRILSIGGREMVIQPFDPDRVRHYDCVFLFTGEDFSKSWARKLAATNGLVIDTSGFWRMQPDVPLILAEINGRLVTDRVRLIASPNCITILPLMALWPLHLRFVLDSALVTTFQSVSGSGVAGEHTLEEESRSPFGERSATSPYDCAIHGNLIPQIGDLRSDGYSEEENALEAEARKILERQDLRISSTCVRVPVLRGHAMAIHGSFRRQVDLQEVVAVWRPLEHLVLEERSTPKDVVGQPRYFIGRLRKDRVLENGIVFWLVADQTICGAAMNVVKIFRLRFGI